MRLAARDVDDGHVEITLTDGSTVRTSDPDVDDRVSAALDHPVRLERLRPADDLDHYRRGVPDSDDMMAELRGMFGREGDEPLPDLSVFPPAVVEFESPPGTYYDAFALLVLSEAALGALARALPDSNADVRRFRPSIVIDTGGDGANASTPGHPEFEWIGQRATIGTATIEFVVACPRCVMVTREISSEIPADRSVLRHVVRDLGQNVGVYATVVTPGVVSVGEQLRLI
jgi:hypothetical protein